jgi:hypothetical protein
MKSETQGRLKAAPKEELAILNEIRSDRELIARLSITPQELEALSKCALLGTLTCKQDMLFILRQIREATGPAHDQTAIFPQPPKVEEEDEAADSVPDFRQIPIRSTPGIITEPGSLEGIVRRRLPEQFGVLFWVVVLVIGLVWNGAIIITRWRDNFMTAIGNASAPMSQAPASAAWYDRLDHFNFLLTFEIMFVAVVAAAMYIRSRRNSRRFKIRPGTRFN